VSKADDQRHDEVEWGSPPPTGKNRYDWRAISEQLRAQPFEWGKIFDHDRISVVNAIRQGAVKPLAPELGFEVQTRNNVREPVRMCSLYLRYNPNRDQSLNNTKKANKRAP